MEHIEPAVFEQFLNYIYSDEKALKLQEFRIIRGLYEMGKQNMMADLCQHIVDILLMLSCIYDAVEVFELAYAIENLDLMTKCAKVIIMGWDHNSYFQISGFKFQVS